LSPWPGLRVFDPALFEVEPGPFRPPGDGNFAGWAPRGDTTVAPEPVRRWERIAAAGATAPRG